MTRHARAAGRSQGIGFPRVANNWRGYDVYDPKDVGFDWKSDEAKRVGTKHDTSLRANSNRGHAFGVDLPEGDQDALLDYLTSL